jgi:hypothetical protein
MFFPSLNGENASPPAARKSIVVTVYAFSGSIVRLPIYIFRTLEPAGSDKSYLISMPETCRTPRSSFAFCSITSRICLPVSFIVTRMSSNGRRVKTCSMVILPLGILFLIAPLLMNAMSAPDFFRMMSHIKFPMFDSRW